MFYEINGSVKEVQFEEIRSDVFTVGFVNTEELIKYGKSLGFDEDTIEASQRVNLLFRTGVDVREAYTFAELRIVNRDGHEDCISIYIKNKFLLIVDILDEDESTINSFRKALHRFPGNKTCEEKVICYFIETLLSDGNMIAEELRNELTEMEELIVQGDTRKEFNADLLALKKRILKYYNYYAQIMDIAETLEENDNEILEEDNLIYISNLTSKVTRRKDDIDSLNSIADHIQEAYATLLDQKMNSTMKVFTIITTIFFPLTIIVGWYGMNFQYMPELTWKYGYIYVSILSLLVVALLVVIGKKKKWF